MKKLLALLAIVALVVLVGGCGSSKLGTVDTERVMQGSAKVKQIQETMMTKQNEARKKMDELTQQKGKMKDDEFQAKQKAIYEDFKIVQTEADKSFQNTMKTGMDKVIKDRGLDAIVYKDAVAGGGVDVTDDVIKALDDGMPKTDPVKAATPAAPATSSSAAPSASGK
ncbi:MAG: OmpH family outer membrane protein [Negativicutes bacterium]|jgi:outer membrane protein